MELRPRRGRSSQLPSTPTIPKPPLRPPPLSSARKKPPATPIHIPSDDEDADPKDAVTAAHQDPKEAVRAAHQEIGYDPALKRDYQDSILPGDSEFETPLSSVAKAGRLRNKVASSNAKRKNKVTSSVKKIAEETCCTPAGPQDVIYIADSSASVLEKVGPDEAMARKVSGGRNGDVSLKERKISEVPTENAPRDSIELAGEVSVMAQEASVKKGEVLSPSSKGKTGQSSKKKNGKKRAEDTVGLLDNVQNGGVPYKVANAKMDQVNDQEHFIDADAPIVTEFQECHGTLSLILSDDEASQVSNAKREVGREVKASASIEAALVKHGQAEASKASSKRRKSRSYKKDAIKEENFGRKLFEETNDATLAYMDKEPEDQVPHKSGTPTNLSKEDERKIDVVNSNEYGEGMISSSIRDTCTSPSGSSKENEVADVEISESNGDRVGVSTAGIEGKDFGNECVHDVSEDSSHGAASSSDKRDEDAQNDRDGTLEVKHEEAKPCFEGIAVHNEECNNTDDDDDNASSGNDDDDEMASVFVNSMKAHLLKISEPSVISMPMETQARQESPFTKSAVKALCVNGSNGSSTGYGLSWSPDIVLSASKNHSAKAGTGKVRNIAEARPSTIWGRDRCLQDGLCVPPVDPLKLNKLAKMQKDDTTGAKWFNLSAPTITPELKKELQLLKLRGALDPKRHYKAEDSKGLPKYFQVGTVVGGPADFYSGRLTKKEQKSSLADELLSDSSLTAYRKRKYTEIQEQKQAGGKGFWKQKKSKRTPAWAKI